VAPTGHAYRLVAWNHAWKVVEPRTEPTSESNSTHGKQGYMVRRTQSYRVLVTTQNLGILLVPGVRSFTAVSPFGRRMFAPV
jgi:hypothetical protein